METVSIAALRPQVWEKMLFKDVMRGLYFMENGMMGSDANNIFQVKTDLEKQQGNTITIGLVTRMTGNGVDGDDEAEGNEEALNSYSETIVLNQKRFPAKTKGKFDEQQNMFNIRTEIKEKLTIRMTEFMERQFFLKLGGVTNTTLTDVNGVVVSAGCAWSNTPDIVPNATTAAGTGERYVCANFTEGADALTSSHTLTPSLITKAKTKAALADPKIVPLRIKGKNYYVLFVHPWQAVDLKNDATYNQARREAEVRGSDNPIFTGALGVWDGVIIHEHEFVPYLDTDLAGFNFGAAASGDRKSTRLNSSHHQVSRMPSSA
jgi:N4-gp56 family major capsid protein